MLRDKIKNINDIRSEIINVIEWDCQIKVVTMSAKDRADLLALSSDSDGNMNDEKFQAGVVIFSSRDPESGEKIFLPEDIEWLMDKSAKPIDLISKIGMKLSGFHSEQVKEIEKNCDSAIQS